ncbi:MAG: YfaZ family protein [Helicobacteraceae bacterium]|jgi:hypothetical protein|nr:YfaZ family protein [Helicobacteraceae bacterium]
MLNKPFLWIACATLTFAQAQHSIWLDLNGNDLEGGYEQNSAVGSSSSLYYGADLLRAEDEYNDMNMLVGAHAVIIGSTPLRGLSVGVGLRGVFAWIDHGSDDTKPFALPIKALAIYTFPLEVHTSIMASFLFAPKSLSFNDADRFTEIRVEAAIEPIEGGMFFAGWREVEFEFGNYDYEFNEAAYFGIRMSF